MNAMERAEVQRYIRLLKWSQDPETPKRMAEAHARMDAGQKIYGEELEMLIAERRRRNT